MQSETITLTAKATDQGIPALHGDVTIEIEVRTDDSQLPPQWTVVNPTFSVLENETVNHVIGNLRARNRTDSKLVFSIVGLNNKVSTVDPSGHFIIEELSDGASANILINNKLDYETTPEFTITVRASVSFDD